MSTCYLKYRVQECDFRRNLGESQTRGDGNPKCANCVMIWVDCVRFPSCDTGRECLVRSQAETPTEFSPLFFLSTPVSVTRWASSLRRERGFKRSWWGGSSVHSHDPMRTVVEFGNS
mmetsp:Transcript_31841/g.65936  ORF Transcript_31841/g.65936 Transcript_31841/m.65936 type:complete len:117 (+) Transcript_31841:1566-1916(+)